MPDLSPARRLAHLAQLAALAAAIVGPWSALAWGLTTSAPAGALVAAGVALVLAGMVVALALATAGHALLFSRASCTPR